MNSDEPYTTMQGVVPQRETAQYNIYKYRDRSSDMSSTSRIWLAISLAFQRDGIRLDLFSSDGSSNTLLVCTWIYKQSSVGSQIDRPLWE